MMPAMGEYGAVGSQGSSAAGGSQGNLFADLTNSVIGSLQDLGDQILAMPPYMLLLLFAAVIIGGLLVFRRV
jgi:hypothetical protein